MRIVAIAFALCFALAAQAADPTANPTDREFTECPECPQMVAIPGGRFQMGSPAQEAGRFDAEGPLHAVTVKAFALGRHNVTMEDFAAFLRETEYQPVACDRYVDMKWNSPGGGRAYPPYVTLSPRWPAFCLNWHDAQAYIAWVNKKARAADPKLAGRSPYRLPTEAEWEYAARAGVTAARWWGEDAGRNNANCNGCGSKWDGKDIAPVETFGPNPFGLYDMLGNVWQWTDDCWNDSFVGAPTDGRAWTSGDCDKKVLRGGSWSNAPSFVRSAARIGNRANGTDFDYSTYSGFRLARTLP